MLASTVAPYASTDDPSVDAEIATVRHALDRSLDEKWDHFRTDFRELWGQFQTECIESSHKLVVAEKQVANERYATLKDAYDKVKAKCADFDRYNQLLQEKLDHVQEEMKSLSAVSMTIQWEKRVANKQLECEKLMKQLEKQKQVNTTLKRENTLLNTQLEQWDQAREAEATVEQVDASGVAAPEAPEEAHLPDDVPVMVASSVESLAEVVEKQPVAGEAIVTTPPPTATDTFAQLAMTEGTSLDAAAIVPTSKELSLATASLELDADTDVTEPAVLPVEPAAQAPVHVTTTEPPLPASTAEQAPEPELPLPASTSAEAPVDVPTTEPLLPESTASPETYSISTTVDVPKPPVITYTLKKLKRKKTDTEKTPFLLGSDNVLYAWTEGNLPGEVVGTKMDKGYKFTNK